LLGYFGEQPDAPCGHCDNCRAGERPVELAEVTDAAQKFLTCVQRTGECFGPTQIIGVLRGSRSQRVLRRRHDRLPVYGTGRDVSPEAWRDLVRQFIAQGLVEQDFQFGGLRLTDKARQVLGGEKVFVRRHSRRKPLPSANERTEHDRSCPNGLGASAREFADQAGAPASSADHAIDGHTPAANKSVPCHHAGEARLANYGEALLHLIRNTALQYPDAPASRRLRLRPRVNSRRSVASRKSVGLRRWRRSTSWRRAAKWHDPPEPQHYGDAGHRLDADRVMRCSTLSPKGRERVLAVFSQLGHEALGPVHDALGGSVPYEELHLLRLYLKCQT
jgi:ATP-dependent DNA helicase RecQ